MVKDCFLPSFLLSGRVEKKKGNGGGGGGGGVGMEVDVVWWCGVVW